MVEYIQFLRGTVTSTGGADFEQVTLTLPNIMQTVSMSQNKRGPGGRCYALILHGIDFESSIGFTADGQTIQWQLTKSTQSAMLSFNDPALIDGRLWQSEGAAYVFPMQQSIEYRIPILISAPQLFFAVQASGSAITGRVRLRYTIREVAYEDYIAGLI